MALTEVLKCEGSSSNSMETSRTSMVSYLKYLHDRSQTDALSCLEDLDITMRNADASWFFSGNELTDTINDDQFNKCSELHTHLATRIHQIGAVREFKGREDKGYVTEDFSGVATMATLCLTVFRSLLNRLVELKDSEERKTDRLVKKLLDTVSMKAFMLCAEHTQEHLWTSENSMFASEALIEQILKANRCATVGEFLNCNQESSSNFHAVLTELKPKLSKSTWKINPAATHVFNWCVCKIRSPQLGDHLPLVLPPMLLLVDDFQIEHKCLGVSLLKHLIDNTSRTELSWYGRAQVIFDALQHQMYTHDATLVHMLHPCLLGILRVVEMSPVKCTAMRKENRYDETVRRILTDMELDDKLVLRRAYVEHLPCFLEEMGITAVRHLVQLLRVISAYLEVYDGPKELCRLRTLELLRAVIVGMWPRMSFYCANILKCLLKFIYDISVDDSLTPVDVSTTLVAKAMECLQLLKCACPEVMLNLMGKLDEIRMNETWDRCVKELLVE